MNFIRYIEDVYFQISAVDNGAGCGHRGGQEDSHRKRESVKLFS